MTEPRTTIRIVRGDRTHEVEVRLEMVDSRRPFDFPVLFPMHGFLYFRIDTFETKAIRFRGWTIHPEDREVAAELLSIALRATRAKQKASAKAVRLQKGRR